MSSTINLDNFLRKSWVRISYDSELVNWLSSALTYARKSVKSDVHTKWLRYGGTWFTGVNALPNDDTGAVGASGPLRGRAVEFIYNDLGCAQIPWDRAQVSVCYPGYPKAMASDSDQAFSYRLNRDAAHVDGLHPIGPDRRRHLRECHAFILGIPMVDYNRGASPFVVWEGSHSLIRRAFSKVLGDKSPDDWEQEDLTETYHEIRRIIFDKCPRAEIYTQPGEAFIVHRLALHGMAPWKSNAKAGEDGRMICYFRPQLGEPESWLAAP